MKSIFPTICCALGGGMIGFFANRLDTVVGSLCFATGIILLVLSILLINRQK